MKIAILLPDLRGGGAERVMVDLAREIDRFGHSVEFVLMQATGDFLPEARRDFAVFDLAMTRTRRVPGALARYLRDRKPGAVVANMWPLTSAAVIGKTLSRWRGLLLLVEHNTLTQQYSEWGGLHAFLLTASMASTYRFADRVAAVSEGSATDTARLARLAPGRVTVLHNPIPQRSMPGREACAIAEKMWGCPSGQRVLTVGSLKDQKNHPLLLRAFAAMARPEARLMLLGQGTNETALGMLASDLGISDRVIFAGFHPDPAPFYATADLFALSSDYEGLPTVLIEALSFGLPVVSTECPSGPAEILKGGQLGRLVPVKDATALARAMDAALSSPVDRDALMRRAGDFAPRVAARKYLDLLGLP
ncbi:glycosyl transferase [Roseovarius sp. 22II1-1F6A]|nr:glycosyl transferase [Roseovarius sp. 22II1-1F6A]